MTTASQRAALDQAIAGYNSVVDMLPIIREWTHEEGPERAAARAASTITMHAVLGSPNKIMTMLSLLGVTLVRLAEQSAEPPSPAEPAAAP